MIIFSWNCRGLGNPWTVQDLCRMVKEKKPDLVFLMETKLRRKKMENIRIKLGFSNMFVVDCIGRSGGLGLFWGEEAKVEVKNFSQRLVNAIIEGPMHSGFALEIHGVLWSSRGLPNDMRRGLY
jgi:exonuclease III